MIKALLLFTLLLPGCFSPTKRIEEEANNVRVEAVAGRAEARSLIDHVDEAGEPIRKSLEGRFGRIEKAADTVLDQVPGVKDRPSWFMGIFESLGRLLGRIVFIALLLGGLWIVIKIVAKTGQVPFLDRIITKFASKGIGSLRETKEHARMLLATKLAVDSEDLRDIRNKLDSQITSFRAAGPSHEGAYQAAKNQR